MRRGEDSPDERAVAAIASALLGCAARGEIGLGDPVPLMAAAGEAGIDAGPALHAARRMAAAGALGFRNGSYYWRSAVAAAAVADGGAR